MRRRGRGRGSERKISASKSFRSSLSSSFIDFSNLIVYSGIWEVQLIYYYHFKYIPPNDICYGWMNTSDAAADDDAVRVKCASHHTVNNLSHRFRIKNAKFTLSSITWRAPGFLSFSWSPQVSAGCRTKE